MKIVVSTLVAVSFFAITPQSYIAFAETGTRATPTSPQKPPRDMMQDKKMDAARTQAERRIIENEEKGQKFEGNLDNRLERREEIKNKFEDRVASGTGKRIEERRQKLEAKSKEKIKHIVSKVFDRLEALATRLEQIGQKIGSRLAKLEEKGISTDSAELLLTEAKQTVSDARSELLRAKTAISNSVEGETSREEIRSQIQDVRNLLEEARKLYLQAVESITTQE